MKNQGKHGVRNVVVLLATLFVLVAGVVKFAPFASYATGEPTYDATSKAWTISSDISVSALKAVEVGEDGSKHKIDADDSIELAANATLTIDDDITVTGITGAGKIVADTSDKTLTVSKSGISVSGDIEVSNGAIASTVDSSDTSSNKNGIQATNISVTGGSITAAGIISDDTAAGLYINGKLNVSGGAVTATGYSGVRAVDIEVTGGTVSGTGNTASAFASTNLIYAAVTSPSGGGIGKGTTGAYTVLTDPNNNNSGAKSATLGAATTPTIDNKTLPTGTVNVVYKDGANDVKLTASNTGGLPITWTESTTALTGYGLTLNSDGTITGTPSNSGTVNFTVKASNGKDEVTANFSITIETAPVVVTGVKITDNSGTDIPGNKLTLAVGESQTVKASVLPPEVTDQSVAWSSDKPTIATVDSSGIITAVATGTATITATSNADSTKKATLTIAVTDAPEVNIKTDGLEKKTVSGNDQYVLPVGPPGKAYSYSFKASGTTPITWEIVSGAPTGLTINKTTGVLSGTLPSDVKTYTIVVKATNTVSGVEKTDTKTFILEAASASTDGDVELTKAEGNTITDATSSSTDTNVYDLDDYAEEYHKEAGKNVLLKMEVDAIASNKTSTEKSSIETEVKKVYQGFSNNQITKDYFTIDIKKYVKDPSEASYPSKASATVTDMKKPIEIVLTIDGLKDKNMGVYRYHDDVQVFTKLNSRPKKADYKDQTYYVSGNTVYLYTSRFSTYAVVYPTTESWTVSFETNGGSAVQSVIAPNNGVISLPTAPTRTGYTFEGWYTDSALTTKWVTSTPITANTTLYAGWKQSISRTTTDADGLRSTNSPQTFDVTQLLAVIGLVCVAVSGAYIISGLRKRK